MDTSTSVLSMAVLTVLISIKSSACEDHLEVKVHPGQNAMLQCRGPGGTIGLLQWIRVDLKSEDGHGYIFFYRQNHPVESYQHPSFHGRVELMDPEMKDGNVSVILKNVAINDTGTYECHIKMKRTGRSHRDAPERISTISLNVEESDGNTEDGKYTHGHVGVILSVIGLLVIIIVVGLVIKGCLKKNSGLTVEEGVTIACYTADTQMHT